MNQYYKLYQYIKYKRCYEKIKSTLFHSVLAYVMVYIGAYMVFKPWIVDDALKVYKLFLVSNAFAGFAPGWVYLPLIYRENHILLVYLFLGVLKTVVVALSSGIYILFLIGGGIRMLFCYIKMQTILQQNKNL